MEHLRLIEKSKYMNKDIVRGTMRVTVQTIYKYPSNFPSYKHPQPVLHPFSSIILSSRKPEKDHPPPGLSPCFANSTWIWFLTKFYRMPPLTLSEAAAFLAPLWLWPPSSNYLHHLFPGKSGQSHSKSGNEGSKPACVPFSQTELWSLLFIFNNNNYNVWSIYCGPDTASIILTTTPWSRSLWYPFYWWVNWGPEEPSSGPGNSTGAWMYVYLLQKP